MKAHIRKQLTMFVDPTDAEKIETARKKFNPLQYGIIKSHLTLCREDELTDLDQVMKNLDDLTPGCLTFKIGEVERSEDGKGVILPVYDENNQFKYLRELVLKGVVDHPKHLKAHITIIHPRNATCTDVIFSELKKVIFPALLTFKKISLIIQEGNNPWEISRTIALSPD